MTLSQCYYTPDYYWALSVIRTDSYLDPAAFRTDFDQFDYSSDFQYPGFFKLLVVRTASDWVPWKVK